MHVMLKCMSVLKVKARIDRNGISTATLPVSAANLTVDVLVDLPPKDSAAESEFLKLLANSFGSMPKIRRAEQGELPLAAVW